MEKPELTYIALAITIFNLLLLFLIVGIWFVAFDGYEWCERNLWNDPLEDARVAARKARARSYKNTQKYKDSLKIRRQRERAAAAEERAGAATAESKKDR